MVPTLPVIIVFCVLGIAALFNTTHQLRSDLDRLTRRHHHQPRRRMARPDPPPTPGT